MSDKNWEQLEAAFSEALELEGADREAFLARLAERDTAFSQRVRDLLAADGGTDAGLRSPIAATVESLSREAKDPWIGRTLGAWTITERLAGGGMGAVFLASRADEQYAQTAALKVMAAQLVATGAISRFRAERQILANLNHPYVAKLIDGGETEDGVPFLVMEYIDGLPIDRHCDQRVLSISERLALFRKVCDAVDYAHRNLVVHRDLKPSNILVDVAGNPKLLDFGIAKLLEAGSYDRTIAMTRAGARAMTPEYASPEQVRGEPVTVAADVYALGVLLFRLMTGQSPYGPTPSTSGDYERAIVEDDPRRPSTVVTSPDTELSIGKHRATTVERLRRSLKGDLDNIVLKALQKEPERRYPTAAALSADIGRYLASEPVEARGADAWYRARKFVVRNARALAVSALVLATVSGLVTYYTARLADERDRATLAAAESQEVAEFLKNLFEQASPHESKGEPLTAIELLQAGRERIDSLDGQSRLQARLMRIMASSSTALGDLSQSLPMLERALEIMEAEDPPDPVGISEVTHDLAEAHRQLGQLTEAEQYERRTLEIATAEFGPDDDRVAFIMARLGVIVFDDQRAAEALELERKALDIMIANGSGESSDAVDTRGNMANVLSNLGRYEEAAGLLRETIELSKKVDGEMHPNTAIRISNLGLILTRRGRHEEAVATFDDAIERARRIWPEYYDTTAFMIGAKGAALKRLGRMDESLAAYREAADITYRHLGPDNTKYVVRLRGLGSVLMDMGRYDEANATFDEAMTLAASLSGPDGYQATVLRVFQGQVANDLGDHVAAQAHLERVKSDGSNVPSSTRAIVDKELGHALSAQRRYAEAEALLLGALEQQQASLGADSPTLLPTLGALAAHYRRAGELDRSLEVAERIERLVANDSLPLTWTGALALGEAAHTLAAAGRAGAQAAYRQAATELQRVFGDNDPRVLALARHLD